MRREEKTVFIGSKTEQRLIIWECGNGKMKLVGLVL